MRLNLSVSQAVNGSLRGFVPIIDWGGKPEVNDMRAVSSSLVMKHHAHSEKDPSIGGSIDWPFLCQYWSALVAILLALFALQLYWDRQKEAQGKDLVRYVEEDETDDLPDTTYALPLAAALGGMKVGEDDGYDFPLWGAAGIALVVFFIQTYTVVLFYDAVDKRAPPITTRDEFAEGIHANTFSTNQMKFVMTILLGMISVDESQAFGMVFRQTLLVRPDRGATPGDKNAAPGLGLGMRLFLLIFPMVQFLSLLLTVVVGLTAMLSESLVLMVVSDAVGIFFVSQIDDYTWKFLSQACGLPEDLKLNRKKGSAAGFSSHIEVLLRAINWIPICLLVFLYLQAKRTDRLPAMPNPLVLLGYTK